MFLAELRGTQQEVKIYFPIKVPRVQSNKYEWCQREHFWWCIIIITVWGKNTQPDITKSEK